MDFSNCSDERRLIRTDWRFDCLQKELEDFWIPFESNGTKQTEDSVFSDHTSRRKIETLFLGWGIYPEFSSFIILILYFDNYIVMQRQCFQASEVWNASFSFLSWLRLFASSCQLLDGSTHQNWQTLINNSKDLFKSLRQKRRWRVVRFRCSITLKNKPRCGWSCDKSVSAGACRWCWKTGTTCIKNSPRDVSGEMWKCTGRFQHETMFISIMLMLLSSKLLACRESRWAILSPKWATYALWWRPSK